MKNYKIGTYHFTNAKKMIKPKKRYNKTYRGSLTKRRKEINSRRAVVILLAGCILAPLYAFAMTHNSYTINGVVVSVEELNSPSGLSSDETKTASFVERDSEAGKLITPVSLPVMIETTEQSNERQIREIAREFGFKWESYIINLACCEGLLRTDTINDKGNYPSYSIDRGLYGINSYWHAEVSDFTAYDLRLSTIWAMNHINNGKQHEFICDKRIRGVEDFYLRCLN